MRSRSMSAARAPTTRSSLDLACNKPPKISPVASDMISFQRHPWNYGSNPKI